MIKTLSLVYVVGGFMPKYMHKKGGKMYKEGSSHGSSYKGGGKKGPSTKARKAATGQRKAAKAGYSKMKYGSKY